MPEPLTPSPVPTVPPIDNVRGAMWMFAAAICFSVMIILVKRLGAAFAAPEIAFFRCLFG